MRSLVLLSGGMDSTVLLAETVDLLTRDNVKALSINYGQRHAKELEAARKVALHYGVPHEVIDVPASILSSPHSSQTSSTPVPHGHYAALNMKTTVVPNRNMFMLSIAVARAIAEDYDLVSIAAHAGDHEIYPDCREDFLMALSAAVQLCDWNPPMLRAPFLKDTKTSLVVRGLRLNVPFQLTWTCYEGVEMACGKCGTCVERLEAFAEADWIDPLPYSDRLSWREIVRIEKEA